jgi:hypothetical protein
VGDSEAVPRNGVEERTERRSGVDEDGGTARLVADKVGVREPLRMHAPLDDHRCAIIALARALAGRNTALERTPYVTVPPA